VINVDDIRLRWQLVAPLLDERGRLSTRRRGRLFAANEALALGHGGVTATALATGIARSTINRGIDELQSGRNDIDRRVRRPGAGRKSAVVHQPGLPAVLEGLIEAAIRGDPCSPLRWVSRSQRQLVRALADLGFKASQRVVANLLRELNYSCQANSKTREGGKHPDRDAQFAHINETVKASIGAGEPAISVDTKKKELVGDFKNNGRELRPKGQPEAVRVHDFKIPELGKVAPYGVYDIAANHGWVSVGVDADTAAFAVESIRRWWHKLGQARLPQCHVSDDHRRLRRQQRGAGQAMEARVAGLCQRNRSERDSRSPATWHQQMEQDRAPPVRIHHHELARQAAGQPSGHCPADRIDNNRNRSEGLLRTRREPIPEGH